ncbi:MAG: PEP-CTERM sorting domain-containing protein [Sedimentisphaerales bacterium]|nr:PEP-CTERM sorting domain-containing protein [Sedimentisphaerales bacterium]
MKKKVTICFVFCLALATPAFANLVDLAVDTSGTVTAALGGLTTFERFNDPSTGTGVFAPFARIQGKDISKGYNTDGDPEFDTKSGVWTHSIKLSDIPVIDGKIQFLLDINQSQAGDNRYLSVDVIKIYLADSGSLDDYASGLGTLIYDLGDNWVKMDNTIFGPGSGTGDMQVSINKNPTWSNDKYLYLYSEFGHHFSSNAGFEEWSTMTAMIPEPATICLLGLGALSLFHKKNTFNSSIKSK